jgi:hypothetical protein
MKAYQTSSHFHDLLLSKHLLVISYMSRLYVTNLSDSILTALLLYASKRRNLLCLLHHPTFTIIIFCNVPTMSFSSITIYKHYKNKCLTSSLNITNTSNLFSYCLLCSLHDNAPFLPPQYTTFNIITVKLQKDTTFYHLLATLSELMLRYVYCHHNLHLHINIITKPPPQINTSHKYDVNRF